ncbi:hypothetical protein [Natrinema sp. HArc-T2]|uniref:hypothetical protein n=1 Tax=Natrinema sp. HArc-T2 TaxID=3242701 RepID=UPI00359D33D6
MQLDVVDDLRQPDYTGENRCEPCTVLNLIIAAVAGSLIARKSRLGGLLAVGISIALIYLRGYLVPGTPTLTKRYLPPAVLRWFGKDPDPDVASGLGGDTTATTDAGRGEPGVEPASAGDVTTVGEADASEPDAEAAVEATEALDLETLFLDHDVLEPCDDRDDLCLTDAFEADWFDAIDAVEESGLDATAAADAFGFDADPAEFDLDDRGEACTLRSAAGVAGRWPSRAALLADVAASHTLESWLPDWDTFDPETKGVVLNGLRMFLETCPSGGDVRMGEEVVESCCHSHEVVAVTCEETGERLFEQRLANADA